MKKEIPEIDSLLEGINDPDAVLNPTSPIEEKPSNEDTQHEGNPPIESPNEIPADPLPKSTDVNITAQPTVTESPKSIGTTLWASFPPLTSALRKMTGLCASSTATLLTRSMTVT